MTTMKIYQIKAEYRREYGFESYAYLESEGVTPNTGMYDLVWEEELESDNHPDTELELQFTRFNLDRPDGFKGHSMSMSDVVVLDGVAYYCDTIGFKQLDKWDGLASMTDLELITEYKVYCILGATELNKKERTAAQKYRNELSIEILKRMERR